MLPSQGREAGSIPVPRSNCPPKYYLGYICNVNQSLNFRLLNKIIGEPFLSMLKDLNGAKGYRKYVQYLSSKEPEELMHSKAEIKALYELYYNGYLFSISAYIDGEPEGLLKIDVVDTKYKGFVEAAFVQLLFDSNENTKKFINKELNHRRNLEFKKFFPDRKIYIEKRKTGSVVVAENIDVNKKLLDAYEKKRKQHKNKYKDFPENVKVYYFLIDYPPHRLLIDWRKLQGNMHRGEIIIISMVYEKNKQTLFYISREPPCLSLKFDNPYFTF
jgi:hypothetical protein